jgi:hypothetical protein
MHSDIKGLPDLLDNVIQAGEQLGGQDMVWCRLDMKVQLLVLISIIILYLKKKGW